MDKHNVMLEARERAEAQRHALAIPAADIAEKMVTEASIRAEAWRRALAHLDDTDRLNWKSYLKGGILFAVIVILYALVVIPFISAWRE